ncbi:hypothetical protein H8959_018427 [Pygathrix nigripes]
MGQNEFTSYTFVPGAVGNAVKGPYMKSRATSSLEPSPHTVGSPEGSSRIRTEWGSAVGLCRDPNRVAETSARASSEDASWTLGRRGGSGWGLPRTLSKGSVQHGRG